MFGPSEKEVDVRLRAAFGVVDLPAPRSQLLRNIRLRIVQVAEGERSRRADAHACREEARLHAVEAERALVDVALRVHEARVVRAGRDARLAPRALAVRHEDDSALVHVARARRAVLHAGRLRAVVAALGADLGGEE